MKFINNFIISLIFLLRPFLGPAQCRFTITCTRFAAKELQEKPLFAALWSIVKRVLSCNPLF